MLIMRKIAQVSFAAGGGKPNDFQQFWPVKGNTSDNHIANLTAEERKEWLMKIKKNYKLN